MKASSKFLLAAACITLLSLVVYDLLLRAEYRSGNYSDPYRNFVTLSYKDFDTLDLPSSTAANVKIVQGPFSIRLDRDASDFVQLKKEGHRLQISAAFAGNYLSTTHQFILIISCPRLSSIMANAGYLSNNTEVTDTIVREDWNMRQVWIEGFRQDSLQIRQDYGSTVVLANNHIRAISAQIGKSPRSGSSLIIQDNNEFSSADLDIQNNSKLYLDNASIKNLNILLGDKSKMIITGKAKNLLNNKNPEK
jgi:hypothetical protein